MECAKAEVSCSSANLGPGFDILGLSLDIFSESVTVKIEPGNNSAVEIIGNNVPKDPRLNSAGLSALNVLEHYRIKESISIRIEKSIPSGFGLGSSGASSSAAVCALDSLFGINMSQDEKIYFAGIGETAASGTPHFDNVAASICGGYTMITSFDPIHAINLRNETKFSFTVIMPKIEIEKKTLALRELLPETIQLKTHIHGSRYLASLIAGIINEDEKLIRSGMNDPIVEKAREKMYPYYTGLKKGILEEGAYGVCLSGAGPSILVISDGTINNGMDDITGSVMDSYNLDFTIHNGKIGKGVMIEGKILQ